MNVMTPNFFKKFESWNWLLNQQDPDQTEAELTANNPKCQNQEYLLEERKLRLKNKRGQLSVVKKEEGPVEHEQY